MEATETLPTEAPTAMVTTGNSPIAAMELALNNNMDIDKLAKILDLQERWEKMEAKKAYTQAMAEFKANPPKINKDKSVSFKQTQYNHASLGNVTEKINKSLAEHGLTAGWKTTQEQGSVTVTCTITHKLGYSESTSLTAGADNSGTKNSIQALGSSISYLQRYTILSLTGLATHDMDNDGQTSEPIQYVTVDQVTEITDKLKETKGDKVRFLKNFNASSIEAIPVAQYTRAINMLKAKAGDL